MSGPALTVGHGVVDEMVRLAAYEVAGVARVGRGGSPLQTVLAGPAVVTHVARDGVRVRVWVVARPGHSLVTVTREVRTAVAGAVERLLGLRLDAVSVTVDGVGG